MNDKIKFEEKIEDHPYTMPTSGIYILPFAGKWKIGGEIKEYNIGDEIRICDHNFPIEFCGEIPKKKSIIENIKSWFR